MGLALRSPEALTTPSRRHLTAVPYPARRKPSGVPPHDGSVRVLHPPLDSGPAAPLRLTRRGVAVVSVAVALAGIALVWLAAVSAPRSAAPGTGAAHPRFVTVRPGDTLWAIAGRLAPRSDPFAEIAVLERANHLTGARLRPGQRLRTG